ncbi:unnamed protein product [Discosporangium mesarthrocarpum]
MRLVLPEDQFLNILSFLVVDSVFAMSETCHQLHEWCSLCKVVDSGEVELEDCDMNLLLRRFPAVNDLTLRYSSRLSSASYKALAEICPQLLSLRVMTARVIDGSTFRDLVRRFDSMRRLSLWGTFYVKSDAIGSLARAGQQLQEVCLVGFRQLRDADVQLLLDSCVYLTRLSVADCTTLGSLVLTSPTLCSLDVSRCMHINDMNLDMPALTHLNSSWCTKLPDTAVEGLLCSCPSLRHLALKGCSALTSPNLESPHLESLDLSLCEKLTTCTVVCPRLTELSVAMCMGLATLNLDLPMMESLDLSMLGVRQLTLNCTSLSYINLRGSHKLSSKVWEGGDSSLASFCLSKPQGPACRMLARAVSQRAALLTAFLGPFFFSVFTFLCVRRDKSNGIEPFVAGRSIYQKRLEI